MGIHREKTVDDVALFVITFLELSIYEVNRPDMKQMHKTDVRPLLNIDLSRTDRHLTPSPLPVCRFVVSASPSHLYTLAACTDQCHNATADDVTTLKCANDVTLLSSNRKSRSNGSHDRCYSDREINKVTSRERRAHRQQRRCRWSSMVH